MIQLIMSAGSFLLHQNQYLNCSHNTVKYTSLAVYKSTSVAAGGRSKKKTDKKIYEFLWPSKNSEKQLKRCEFVWTSKLYSWEIKTFSPILFSTNIDRMTPSFQQEGRFGTIKLVYPCHFLLNCLYQDRKVSCHVFVC